MATWNQVREMLTSKYPIKQDNGNDLIILFEIPNSNRKQTLIISKANTNGLGEWVQIASPIGTIPANRVDEALTFVANLAFGGLIKVQQIHFLRESMAMDIITSEILHGVISTVVIFADKIEEVCLGVDNF